MKINVKQILEELQSNTLQAESDDPMVTLEDITNQDHWLQITPDLINAFYPFPDDPAVRLNSLKLLIPPSIRYTDYQPDKYIVFEYDSKDLSIVERFIRAYINRVMDKDLSLDNWVISGDVIPDEKPGLLWQISESKWNTTKNKWDIKPVLNINGRDYTFETPHGYIDKLNATGDKGPEITQVIDYLQGLINDYQVRDVLKKNAFTYIGIILVLIPLTAFTFQWVRQIFIADLSEGVLPAYFFKSNFFWVLATVGTIYVLFTKGFDNYSVVYKNSSGRTVESADMTDQMGAGLLTFLSPLFSGMGVAIIPYYIAYFLINQIAAISIYLLAFLAIAIYGVMVWIFLKTRPIDRRKKEVLWIAKWLLIAYILMIFTGVTLY